MVPKFVQENYVNISPFAAKGGEIVLCLAAYKILDNYEVLYTKQAGCSILQR